MASSSTTGFSHRQINHHNNLQINLRRCVRRRMRVRIRDGAVQLPQLVHVVQDVNQAEGEHGDHVERQRQQEEEEVAVVAPPDAVVHPGAVVVKVLGGKTRREMKKKKRC